MALAFETEPTFTPGVLTQLFEWNFTGGGNRWMAVSPDGRRFLFLANTLGDADSEATRSQVIVVQKTASEKLKQRVPTETSTPFAANRQTSDGEPKTR